MQTKKDAGVILVVGTDKRSKSRVADAIADAVGAWELEIVMCGVRNFTSKSEVAVVDTAPFYKQYVGQHVFHEAKRWVADNALRRILGKRVCVVCVISGADALIKEESQTEEKNFYLHVYSWLDFLGDFIFPEHKESIIFVSVNGDETFNDTEALTEMWRMRNFIERHKFATNITHVDLRDRDSFTAIVNSAVRNIFRLETGENSKESGVWDTSKTTFHIRDLPMNLENVTRLGPWIPDRMILFGRSGSGKSTLAQMLTMGRLDPHSEHFTTSSSIRGETTRIHHGEGRGWYVVDTPGFGEEKGGSITSEEGERKIKRYTQMIGGIYTHYIYVVKKGRIDKLEEILWKFFISLFGESIKDHFTVVVSDADRNWLAENVDDLRKTFVGCESFLSADFPKVQEGDEELEMESQAFREESLKELELGLMSLRRSDTWCLFGEWSKMTELDGVSEALSELHSMTGGYQRAVNLMRIGAYRFSTGVRRFSVLMAPNGSLLLPLGLLDA
ncbi:unnamed protein product [Calypogeia fissa]